MITLAGVELAIDDPEGILAGWVNQFLPLGEMRDQMRPAALVSQRTGPRTSYEPGVSLPLPNYSEPPAPKVSTLYWPTGATRWARGYFLASTDQMEAVLAETGDLNLPVELALIDQDAGVTVAAEMYLMPPRPLSNVLNAQNVYLLPLVDARYWWQFLDVDELEVILGETTWQDLFDTCSLALGTFISNDPILPTYFFPDPDGWSRPYENVALLLDAVAHSLGMRIVRQLDGTLSALSWLTSEAIYLASDFTLANAGGDFSALNPAAATPEAVAVSFTKWREGAVDPEGDQHIEVNPTGELSTPDTFKTIFTSAFADFTSKGLSPDNFSPEVAPLALQIALDYFGYQSVRYDASFPSLVKGELSGFDDFALWSFGSLVNVVPIVAECPPGEGDTQGRTPPPKLTYQASTRLQSQAPNFGVSEQLSQFPDKAVHPKLTRYTLTAPLTKSDLKATPPVINSAAAVHRIWDRIGLQYQDSTDVLKVYDALGQVSGATGDHGWAEYKGDSLRWEAIASNPAGPFIFLKLNYHASWPYSTPTILTLDFGFIPTGDAAVSIPLAGGGLDSNDPKQDFNLQSGAVAGLPTLPTGEYLIVNKAGVYQFGFHSSFNIGGDPAPNQSIVWTAEFDVIADNILAGGPAGPLSNNQKMLGVVRSTNPNPAANPNPNSIAILSGDWQFTSSMGDTITLKKAGAILTFYRDQSAFTVSATGLAYFSAGSKVHMRLNLNMFGGFLTTVTALGQGTDRFHMHRIGDAYPYPPP